MADSDEEINLPYLKKEYFHPVSRPWFGHPGSDDKSTGEDSNNLFMSEPSMSEADSSEHHMSLLSPMGSLSGDSDDDDCLPPPPPPARLLNAQGPHSPGNTSLSSWESPHLDKQVHIHFTPDRTRRRGLIAPSSGAVNSNKDTPNTNQQAESSGIKTPDRGIASQQSSNSTSPSSERHTKQLEVFLDDLRIQSQGQMQEQSATNVSFDSSFQGPNNNMQLAQGIIRSRMSQHDRMNSMDTAVIRNTSGGDEDLSAPILPNTTEQDDTIVMELSGSEDEFSGGTNTTLTNEDSSLILDWEQQHSADDEKTQQNERKIRVKQQGGGAKTGSGHRRQRSGDAAAATISTGSKEWKGMATDNIPLPPAPGGHDDDEDDDHPQMNQLENDRDTSPKQSAISVALAGNSAPEVTQFSDFVIGVAGTEPMTSSSRKESRRQRRARKSTSHDDSESSSITSNTSPLGSHRSRPSPFLREKVPSASSPMNHSGYYPSPQPGRLPVRTSATETDHSRAYQHQRSTSYYESPAAYQPAQWAQFWTPNSYDAAFDHSSRYNNFRGPALSPRSDSGSQSFQRVEQSYETIPLTDQSSPKGDDFQNDSESSKSDTFQKFQFQSPGLHASNPFSNFGKAAAKVDRRRFLPQTHASYNGTKTGPTYVCPVCRTTQREFFTVQSAPAQFESPGGYIALYFGIYVIGALYIFGLQEGWGKLDCIYFAVITLTTAGLGDFVPTSNGAKVICSIFIYFGVACIGLLLGSYIAGMLDENSSRRARQNRINACPNCTRIQNIKDDAERRTKEYHGRAKAHAASNFQRASQYMSEGLNVEPSAKKMKREHIERSLHIGDLTQSVNIKSPTGMSTLSPPKSSPPLVQSFSSSSTSPVAQQKAPTRTLGSPMTSQILGRQSHTRHSSLGEGRMWDVYGSIGIEKPRRRFSAEIQATIDEADTASSKRSGRASVISFEDGDSSNTDSDDDSASSSSVCVSELGLEKEYSSVKNAKYVFLTLREALLNSMVIIAFGCMGFYFIEGFSFIDSWYFTTVLLTTVGYGDIVPHTKGGKLFATVYILVAGTILLNNMSMISMIPLELRRRRTELAVLNQFGDSLDDAALRELATGPLIQRLNLSTNHPGGLDECTREMFSLAMLVRLGKVSEDDIKLTFAAFRKLDLHEDGVLNSKSIIAGMIQRHRSTKNLASMMENHSQPQLQQQQLHAMGQSTSSMWNSNSSWATGIWAPPPTVPPQQDPMGQPPSSLGSSWGTGIWAAPAPPPPQNGTTNEHSSLVTGQPNYGLHQEHTSPGLEI